MPTFEIRDNCGGLPLPPEDHARSNLSHLVHAGGTAPAASSCRILGRDSDQCLGTAQSFWQWQLQGGHVPRGVRVAAYGAWLQFPLFFFFFAKPCGDWGRRWGPLTGLQWWQAMNPSGLCDDCRGVSLPPVDHARGINIALTALIPLAHTRGAWPQVACTRNAQSPLSEQESSCCR